MTQRKKQIIKDMRAEGLSYAAIADMLGFSQNTVKSFCHRENLSDRKDESVQCKNCGRALTHQYGKKKKSFCSDKCRSDWWNRNRTWARRVDMGDSQESPII